MSNIYQITTDDLDRFETLEPSDVGRFYTVESGCIQFVNRGRTLKEAVAAQNEALRRAGGPWEAFEGNEEINSASRAIVAAMAAENGGEAWLLNVNLYDYGYVGRAEPPMRSASSVSNWEASYVLPAYDQTLVDMIFARHAAPYTTALADSALLDPILQRIHDLGGVYLIWS